MSILITGGNGFLGSYLKENLDSQGMDYYAPSSKELDICNLKSIQEFFQNNRIDKVIHLAANADHTSGKSDDVNIIGTYNVVRISKEFNIKHFVYASTNNVYSVSEALIEEDDPKYPSNQYGVAKLIGEWIVKENFENFSILRFSDIYGYQQKFGNLMKVFIKNSMNKESIQIVGSGVRARDYLYVLDAARSIVHVIVNRVFGVYNVSTAVATSTLRLAQIINQVFKSDLPIKCLDATTEDTSKVILNNHRLIQSGFNINFSLLEGLNDMRRIMLRDEKQN